MRSLIRTIQASLVCAMVVCAGCAGGRTAIRASSPNSEVVTAEGMAPVINGDMVKAKEAALHDALKNALGLVVGVYVSQEALVAKAALIEDNITSQTEGYVEKYDIIKEKVDGDFYHTAVKALVRKDDLSARIKSLELEPKKLGNPSVRVDMDESVDGSTVTAAVARNEIQALLSAKGFVVTDDPSAADIIVQGTARSAFNTDQGMGGMISYRATIELAARKTGSGDAVANARSVQGGVDVTRDAAARTSLLNAARKAGTDLPDAILAYLRSQSLVRVTVSGVKDMNQLNDLIRSLRALIEVRDCRVRSFTNGVAALDADMKKGTAAELARRMETLDRSALRVTRVQAYDISAEYK